MPWRDANIEVDVIIQNISKDGKTDFSFTVHRNDYQRTVDLLKEPGAATLGRRKWWATPRSARSIVGIGMRSHVGVGQPMFRALSEDGINIQMISTENQDLGRDRREVHGIGRARLAPRI